MKVYECDVCGHMYDEKKEVDLWNELVEDWECPVCESEKDFFQSVSDSSESESSDDDYLSEWSKKTDKFESYISDIHKIAETGESITEAMSTKKKVISWDELYIKGAQLAKMPINSDEPVNVKTTIGVKAKQPLVLDTPIYISHMSFGALSKEVKTALAKGSATAKTAISSGEGGILPQEIDNSYKYIFEYIPNEYSVSKENLKRVDAIEIKIGQGTKPGMGGHLPGDKVSKEIAEIRGKKVGEDIYSPSHFSDIRNKEELKAKVSYLREESGGKPIGVKIAAGNIEEDLEIIIYAKPDFVTIDGRGGATGSSPKFIKDSTSIPTLFAIYRAKEFFNNRGIKDISLVITGGLRISSDFAKAIALGADAVAIATSAMIAAGCQQYRMCHTGKCPVGIATQNPELRKRLKVDVSAKRVANFIKVSTEELRIFARITGNDDIHNLSIADISTTNSEISDYTKIKHIGGKKND